jgi:hypothetical protein
MLSYSNKKMKIDMNKSGEGIRQSLHTMLTQAEIDYEMWLAMRNARSDPDLILMLNRRYGRFYISAQNAFFNSLVTILYAVFEKRKDSVNFWNLRKTLPSGADPVVLKEIDEELSNIQLIWRRISIIRNEVVGHQTLSRSRGESNDAAGLRLKDLQSMLRMCQELLIMIAQKFHDTSIIFNLKGVESFEKLLMDLRASPTFMHDVKLARTLST